MEREVKISIHTKDDDKQSAVIFSDGSLTITDGNGDTVVLRQKESRLLMEALQIVHGRL